MGGTGAFPHLPLCPCAPARRVEGCPAHALRHHALHPCRRRGTGGPYRWTALVLDGSGTGQSWYWAHSRLDRSPEIGRAAEALPERRPAQTGVRRKPMGQDGSRVGSTPQPGSQRAFGLGPTHHRHTRDKSRSPAVPASPASSASFCRFASFSVGSPRSCRFASLGGRYGL